MDIDEAKKQLAMLEGLLITPRRRGWDQAALHAVITKRYGSVENFVKAEINRLKQAIDFALVEAIDCD